MDRDFIDSTSTTQEEFEEIFLLTDDIIKDPLKYSNRCQGRILADLFFEPSTRTKFSFEAAMKRLGGNVIGFTNTSNTSLSKGESFGDTIKMVSSYCDIIVIRHPKEGSALLASENSCKPVINAGDGGHNHPTQTLTDLYTIRNFKKRLNNLKIGICGDLKYGRTVHSLIETLASYENNHFTLISPPQLRIPDYIFDVYLEDNIDYEEVSSLENAIFDLDILYMTRIQKERFSSEEEYKRVENCFILNKDLLKNAHDEMMIMHPLPRNKEISFDVDDDKRAWYFRQAKFGMYVRMALLLKLLEV